MPTRVKVVNANIAHALNTTQTRNAVFEVRALGDAVGFQEINPADSVQAVRDACPTPAWDRYALGVNEVPVVVKDALFKVEDSNFIKVHDSIDRFPGSMPARHITVVKTLIRGEGNKARLAFVNVHAVNGVFNGTNSGEELEARREQWWTYWRQLNDVVDRLVAAGWSVVLIGDMNRQRADLPTIHKNIRWFSPADAIIVTGVIEARGGAKLSNFSFSKEDTASDHNAHILAMDVNGAPAEENPDEPRPDSPDPGGNENPPKDPEDPTPNPPPPPPPPVTRPPSRPRAGLWRYFAQDYTPDGPGEIVELELPMRDVEITDVLTGPNRLTGRISPRVDRLMRNGRPILRRWGSLIWAEVDEDIVGGGILTNRPTTGAAMSLDVMGLAGYPSGMPYTGSIVFPTAPAFEPVDVLDAVRHIWAHLQGEPRGNLDLQLDNLKTGQRIGGQLTQEEFDPEDQEGGAQPVNPGPTFEFEPLRLAWYETLDLGDVIDNLAADCPFDYREVHFWNPDGTIGHKLQFGYPMLGRRRENLSFIVGENVAVIPDVDDGENEYASDVMVLGAGEGRTMMRGYAAREEEDRIRRVAVIERKNADTARRANYVARRLVAGRTGMPAVTSVQVRDHRNAPIGSYEVGDEILLEGDLPWDDIDQWSRIIERSYRPDSPNVVTLTLVPSDRLA